MGGRDGGDEDEKEREGACYGTSMTLQSSEAVHAARFAYPGRLTVKGNHWALAVKE